MFMKLTYVSSTPFLPVARKKEVIENAIIIFEAIPNYHSSPKTLYAIDVSAPATLRCRLRSSTPDTPWMIFEPLSWNILSPHMEFFLENRWTKRDAL